MVSSDYRVLCEWLHLLAATMGRISRIKQFMELEVTRFQSDA